MTSLLPPNATAQELALEQAMLPDAGVRAAIDKIRTAKEAPPDDWLLFLVWEYGLEQLLPYFSDLRELIAAGIPWQRIRGTPASLEMALSWIGSAGAATENEEPVGRHWFEFQIDPGAVPNGRQEIELVKQLAALSSPTGTHLARIYHGYDVRRMIWSDGGKWDEHLYSDYSGVMDADGVKLSFGRSVDALTTAEAPAPYSCIDSDKALMARYEDRPLLDYSRIEDVAVLNYESFLGREIIRGCETEVGVLWAFVGMNWHTSGAWADGYLSTSEMWRDYRVLDADTTVGATWNIPRQWSEMNANWNNAGPQSYSVLESADINELPDPLYLLGHASMVVSLTDVVQRVTLAPEVEQVWIENRGSTDVVIEFLDDPLDADSFRIPQGLSLAVTAPYSDPAWNGKLNMKRPAGSAAEIVLISAGIGA